MHTLILILAASVADVNEIARQMQRAIDGTDAGQWTFTAALRPVTETTDANPPTHYWCAVQLSAGNRALCEGMLAEFPGALVEDYDLNEDPGYPQRRLGELGLRTPLGIITLP